MPDTAFAVPPASHPRLAEPFACDPDTGAAVKLINARAVTVYLWHYPLITVAVLALTPLAITYGSPGYYVLLLAVELVLVAISVAAFGWVEDVAARRRPSLWPLSKPKPKVLEPVG